MKLFSYLFLVLLVGLAAGPLAAGEKIYLIGALAGEDQFVPAFEGFKKRMEELGYIEGKNIKYEFQNGMGDHDRLKKLAKKLVQEKPDVIVTSSTTATLPVAGLTEGTDLPVVFLSAGDPLRFVKSYASSENNMTGIASGSLDLIAKRLELLKELSPNIKRVIILFNPLGPNPEQYLQLSRDASRRLGLTPVEREIRANNAGGVKAGLASISRKMGDAVFTPPDAIFVAATEAIVQLSIREKLPVVGPNVQTVRKGMLAGYSSDYYSLGQQGAVLVNKILKGAKPTDLPIEQPGKLQLVLNLKTAKAIGLTIPKEILLRADEVVQ